LTTTYCCDQSRLRKVKRRSSSPHKLPNTLLTVAQLGGDEALPLSWNNSHRKQEEKNATNCHGWSTAMRSWKKGRSLDSWQEFEVTFEFIESKKMHSN